MPNHLSVLGIIHTALSVLAIFAAVFALFKDGKINPVTGPGKSYILLTVLTCLTSLPIMKTGHFTGAHGLAVIVLALIPLGVYIRSIQIFGKAAEYIQVLILSSTIFFSMIPATVETLTRLPISSPIASGPNDPVVQKGLLLFVILFVSGVTYQFVKINSSKKAASSSESEVTPG